MKLKKINEEHYVVVDETEIKEGDWMYNPEREPSLLQCIGKGSIRGWKKITHSTQPIEIIHTSGVTMTNPPMGFINIIELPLSEVKELIGEVDKAKEYAKNKYGEGYYPDVEMAYNQALEDNKEKKYTEEDLRKAMQMYKGEFTKGIVYSQEKIIQYFQPKTEWEVKFINGKLTLI